jgi:hypothetical protein
MQQNKRSKNMAKKQAFKKPTITELMHEIQSLKKALNGKGETKQTKLTPTGRFTLEILDAKSGEAFYRLRGLSGSELHRWRRDLYKILVTSMKMKISMSKVPEFKKAGVK